MANIYYAALMERSVNEVAVRSLMNVAAYGGVNGFIQMSFGYNRTDISRNTYVKYFLDVSRYSNDIFVMLDCDHNHPSDIVGRLAKYIINNPVVDVVGALMFKRVPPYEPNFFIRDQQGNLGTPERYNRGLIPVSAVSTAAIAIKRSTFETLATKGYHFPFFRYEYQDRSENYASEDMYFCRICEQAGIKMYCDTALITPHITTKEVAQEDWNQSIEGGYLTNQNIIKEQKTPTDKQVEAKKIQDALKARAKAMRR